MKFMLFVFVVIAVLAALLLWGALRLARTVFRKIFSSK
jgi:hypothetical protein